MKRFTCFVVLCLLALCVLTQANTVEIMKRKLEASKQQIRAEAEAEVTKTQGQIMNEAASHLADSASQQATTEASTTMEQQTHSTQSSGLTSAQVDSMIDSVIGFVGRGQPVVLEGDVIKGANNNNVMVANLNLMKKKNADGSIARVAKN